MQPVPLTHEQRLAVINAPWPSFRVVEPKTWGGAMMHQHVPSEGRRVYTPTPEDEQYYVTLED